MPCLPLRPRLLNFLESRVRVDVLALRFRVEYRLQWSRVSEMHFVPHMLLITSTKATNTI